MSQPFVILDSSSDTAHDDNTDNCRDDTQVDSFKSIKDISPRRMNLYMQQFTSNSISSSTGANNTHGSSSYKNSSYSNGRKRTGRRGFKRKKKRIKTLGITSNTCQRDNSASASNYNYYNDDPGFQEKDFNMQWEGISRVGLNTKLE